MGMDLDLTMFDVLERKKFLVDLNAPGTSEDQGQLDQKSRSASDEIKGVNLVFTEERLTEFMSLIEFFQLTLQVDSITDVILEVLRSAKDSIEVEPIETTKTIRRKKA